jgi:hypothetical protein
MAAIALSAPSDVRAYRRTVVSNMSRSERALLAPLLAHQSLTEVLSSTEGRCDCTAHEACVIALLCGTPVAP